MKGAAHAGLVIITLTHHLTHDIQQLSESPRVC